ncbi:MAG: tetratricopeptide repeat protein [Alphaproteobacteria bacterium]
MLRQALELHQSGRRADAVALYRRILALDSRNADASHLLGVLLLQTGDLENGIAAIARAIALNDRAPLFHLNLARAYRAQGQAAKAAASFRHALALKRDDADALLELAALERERGDMAAAEESLRRAARLNPPPLAALNNLASLLLEQNRLEDARPVVERAVARDARSVLAQANHGQLLVRCGRPEDAVEPLRRAVAADPANVIFRNNLGIALHQAHRPNEAIAVLREAAAMAPDVAMLRVSLGNALLHAGQPAAALSEFLVADALRPDVAEVLSHIGSCHMMMMRYDEALAALARCVAVKPEYAPAHFTMATIFLAQGRFEAGWRDYVWRPDVLDMRDSVLQAPHGENLAGATVLVRRDQGLGDEIFFLRFLPELRRRGPARVVYAADAKIVGMLRRVDGLDEVIASDVDLPSADIVVAVGDLPLFLRMTTAEHIPQPLVLRPLADRSADLRARLAAFGPPPYIGVTWRGGTENAFGVLFKQAPLVAIGESLAGLPGTLLALQRLPKPGEIEQLTAAAGRAVHDLTALNENLEEMLSLLALLDDYVCVSNTNMHLRAGVGKPSRVLVPCPPEFRWMADGDQSPWFPGSRIYRQDVSQSWDKALADLRRDMQTNHRPAA